MPVLTTLGERAMTVLFFDTRFKFGYKNKDLSFDVNLVLDHYKIVKSATRDRFWKIITTFKKLAPIVPK